MHNLRILRNAAFKKQRGLCWWCKEPMIRGGDPRDERALTGEHLIRRVDGGKTRPGNIVAACRKCNNERHVDRDREQAKGSSTYTCGDDRAYSPFEILF